MRKSIVLLTTFAALVFAGPALHAQEAVSESKPQDPTDQVSKDKGCTL
jgi:hypothetical protein